MKSQEFIIRQTTEEDWQRVRDLRLEMIQDTPIAFGETLEHALTLTEAEWRERGARGVAENGTVMVAITSTGEWIGTMGSYIPNLETGPLLVGVYVTPTWRGSQTGLADALLEGIENWARARSPQLTLEVHEGNLRAQRYYELRGYARTGNTSAYELNTSKTLIEMTKYL